MFKIKNLYLYLLLPLLFIALNFLWLIKSKLDNYIGGHKARINLSSRTKTEEFVVTQSNYVGERIIYDVRIGKISLGKTQFNNLANVQVDGRSLGVMTMETKLTRFTDKERIYTDLETLLPVKVEREVTKLFNKEKIIEDYDQTNFTVTIIKNNGSKGKKLVINKTSPIHNALLLPYYVRRIPRLEVGRIIIANLPTRRLEIELDSIENITVPAGTFKAYHLKSTPRQIEIWISSDERRIPLKIQGIGLFSYSMVMKEYSFNPDIVPLNAE